MKFENIKIGDTVFIQETVSCGWRDGQSFYLPKKVMKVTSTQFTIEDGGRYKKVNGLKIGGAYCECAKLDGEKKEYSSNILVSDETAQMNLFIRKINKERAASKQIEAMSIKLNSKLTIEELDLVLLKIKEINAILVNK